MTRIGLPNLSNVQRPPEGNPDESGVRPVLRIYEL